MAESTDPVRIVVELVDNYSDELVELKTKLEEIGLTDLDVDLDIHEEEEVASVEAALEALEAQDIDVDLDINDNGEIAATQAKLTALDSQIRDVDIGSIVDDLAADTIAGWKTTPDTDFHPGQVPEGALPSSFGPGGPGSGLDMFDDNSAVAEFSRRITEATNAADAATGRGGINPMFPGALGSNLDMFGGRGSGGFFPMFDPGSDIDLDLFGGGGQGGGVPGGGGLFPTESVLKGITEWSEEASGNFGRLGRTLSKYKPSMMMWWNILAAFIPIMISLAGAALGVASAFIALGAAAAGVLGLGLLGWGDSMSESMSMVKKEISAVASEIFNNLRPAMQPLSDMTKEWIEGAPGQIATLKDEIRGLQVFEDELEAVGSGLVGFTEDFFAAFTQMDEIIGDVVMRFGRAIGTFLIETMQALIRDVNRNWNAYAKLANLLVDVIVVIFNVSKAIGFAIAQFAWLSDLLKFISQLMASKLFVALLSVVTMLGVFEAAAAAAGFAIAVLSGETALLSASLFSTLFPSLAKGISMLWSWVIAAEGAAMATRAFAAAALGIGGLAAVIGGGMLISSSFNSMSSGRQPGAGGAGMAGGGAAVAGGSRTVINIQGDVRRREMNKILDKVPSRTRGEMKFQENIDG